MNVFAPLQRLRRRKSFDAMVNTMSRAAGVGNYWYWLDPPELADGIDIAALVCPLRYDVLVRRDFLAFYADHRDLYAADFDAFIKRTRQSTYYVWFMESEAVRCKRHLLGDDAALQAEFVSRVRRAVALYEAVAQHGFARQFPIILKTAEHLLSPTADKLAPPTGKHVAARYFLADGCHRLALLMAMGYTVLPAAYFRVKCFRRFSPFDSTSLLVQRLAIDEATYCAFLSSYYCAPFVFEKKDDLLAYVAAHKPEYVQEVVSVMWVDGFDVLSPM